MSNVKEALYKCYESIKDRVPFEPDVALVLGSGLGDFADCIENKVCIPYNEIEGFPTSTVAGHAGMFVLGNIGNIKIIAMKGRVHYYEGYTMDKVVLPIRIMKLLGAKTFVVTNAAGGINTSFTPGDLMMITDQITSFVPSPLIGPNIEELGTRFPDMSAIYTKTLQEKMRETAKELGVEIKEGVYLQTTGPAYETPAEIRMFRTLGADAVGMSTTVEATVARHMGMEVAGVSCITNMASGILDAPLNHKEVQETADKVKKNFGALIKNFILKL